MRPWAGRPAEALAPRAVGGRARSQGHLLAGLGQRLAVMVVILVLVFLLPRMLPGDAVDLLAAPDAARAMTDEETRQLREVFGLDAGLAGQFLAYVGGLLRGDLGHSVTHAQPVASLISAALPWSVLLVVVAIPLYLVISVACGIEAGRRAGGPFDRIVTLLFTALASLPPFSVAILLLLGFGILWPVLPSGGAQPLFPSDQPLARALEIGRHAVLPVVALAAHEVVRFYFVVRGEALGLSARPFMLNARARGVSPRNERLMYFGGNLVGLLAARLTDSVSALFGALIFVEVVFAYPGIGLLLYQAILDRDHTLVQGIVLVLAALFLVISWALDGVVTRRARRG
jgi:peptide/nickel transport system permease protein